MTCCLCLEFKKTLPPGYSGLPQCYFDWFFLFFHLFFSQEEKEDFDFSCVEISYCSKSEFLFNCTAK